LVRYGVVQPWQHLTIVVETVVPPLIWITSSLSNLKRLEKAGAQIRCVRFCASEIGSKIHVGNYPSPQQRAAMDLVFAPRQIETWPIDRLRPCARNAIMPGQDR